MTSAAERAAGAPAPGRPGKPALTWCLDQDTIDAEAATDGWYALLTSLDASITATEVLLRYKGQEAAERRYGNLKGPLAVAPMFLNSNRRIAALITVISLTLLIFCLIEREARRSLAPQTRIDGLYNRQPARPTGRLILTALASPQLNAATATTPAQIIRPDPVQARLLELLGVDPTRPPGHRIQATGVDLRPCANYRASRSLPNGANAVGRLPSAAAHACSPACR